MSSQQSRRQSLNSDFPPHRLPTLRGDSSKSTSSTEHTENSTNSICRTSTPRTPFTPTTQASAQNHFRVPPSPRLAGTATNMSSESASKAAKVAIPRLKRSLESGDGGGKSSGRHRVTHACEPCRHRKTKCSGERPVCRHCQDFKIQCYYADGKRDRVKKQFGSMSEKVQDYEKVLRELQARVSDEDAALIKTTLERAAQLDADELVSESVPLPSIEPEEVEASGGESEASCDAGSTGALDRTEEDFTREGAKITGFMGKNSDVTWLQRLKEENQAGEDGPPDGLKAAPRLDAAGNLLPTAEQSTSIQDTSYHLNDLAISTYDAVDPYELPTQEHAQSLFLTYMNRVHSSFPIVGRNNLHNQFIKFFARPVNRPPPKWLAIINMIFAIAAKYSHLIQAEWQADERDHLIYFTRARMLVIDSDTMFNHPDLQMIQITGLMAYYMVSIDQINRAWSLTGFAIRAGTAIGLNMRNDSPDLADGLKEIRYRVWWSLYTLEHRLCAMTGRVHCIIDEHCTTPLPAPVAEDEFETELGKKLLSKEHQSGTRAPAANALHPPVMDGITPPSSRSDSKEKPAASRSPSMVQGPATELDWARDVTPNPVLYFLHLVQLSRITQLIFHQLYNPSAINGKWSEVQGRMDSLNQQLEGWYRKLPPAFDFRRRQRDKDFYEARISLGFFYYNAKEMLHRPCLCRLDRKIPNQSQKSNDFNHASATICVTSAQEQLQLIPDEPNAVGLLRVGPWASILHLIVQSATVLMMELAFRAHHMPEQAGDILDSSKKAVRWLHSLGDENLAAARAWRLCNDLLHQSARKIGHKVEDIPDLPPRSAGPGSDGTNMSTSTTIQQMYGHGHGSMQPHDRHYHAHSQNEMPMVTLGMADMVGYGTMGSFNPLMQYDQYLPGSNNINPAQMQYTQNMQYENLPANVDMDYMNTYTNHVRRGPGSSGSQGGRSRYT